MLKFVIEYIYIFKNYCININFIKHLQLHKEYKKLKNIVCKNFKFKYIEIIHNHASKRKTSKLMAIYFAYFIFTDINTILNHLIFSDRFKMNYNLITNFKYDLKLFLI